MNYCYRFPVVKGIQAGREYFIAMVPLQMLKKIFPDDEEYVLPEFRAQRKLNETRIPEIKRYILNNQETYVFSALAASIDGKFKFFPSEQGETGVLEVDLSARFLINDGQHRKAAILAALEENQELGSETISVVFYEDRGLARSQQMFTDLNKHAVKTSNSISELYDSRDPLAVITRKVIAEIEFLNVYVDKEKDCLGKYSSALFTLNTFYMANKRILGRGDCDRQFERFLKKFWTIIVENMIPWNEVKNRELSKKELREQYIATQAVVIQAFGKVGAYLYTHAEYSLDECLPAISGINWRRNSNEWRMRVIRNNGRMINNTDAIMLAGNVIKRYMGLPYTEDELSAEQRFESDML